jgi:hypothetical protein
VRCTDCAAALLFVGTLAVLTACAPPPAPVAAAPAGVREAHAPAPARAVPPEVIRTVEQLRLSAARRIVAANPQHTFSGPAPNPLLAIPVLEIELHADGSVRRIVVLRQPTQARDTTQLAIDAVRRAAPFGDLSSMSGPRKFSETFLFDDERRFKPRSLEP